MRELVSGIGFKAFSLLPTKELKRRKLDEARAALVKGEKDGDGNQIFGGLSKPESQLYISAIEFLSSFIPASGDVEEAKKTLEIAKTESAEYAARFKELLEEARGPLTSRELSSLVNAMPDIKPIGELVDYIRNDWNTAVFVIRSYWPDGKEKAEQLRELLFSPPAVAESQELAPDEEVTIRRQA